MNAVRNASWPESLLKPGDVAQRLSISTRTLWRLLSAKKIPEPVRVGGSTRWRAADIENWLERGCPALDRDQES
jgi:excisionase family DNA binding protein